jgi:hypothetical protein
VIRFDTDEHRSVGMGLSAPVFWASWRWTGDEKYLKPIINSMNSINSNMLDIASLRQKMMQQQVEPTSDFTRYQAWQLTGNKRYLETVYRNLLETATLNEYINTLGYIWTDRIRVSYDLIQRSRMGGVNNLRNNFYAGNGVSWRFRNDNDAEKIAILVPFSTPKELKLEFFNTDTKPMEAQMTGWDVLNGEWELVQGIDSNGNGNIDSETARKKVTFGKEETVTLNIPPRQNVLVRMTLIGDGVDITKNRPDLAICKEDIQISGNQITVTVHNLGYASAPATEIALTDRSGKTILQTATIPPLEGVHDLLPKRVQVMLNIPPNVKYNNCQVVIDPKNIIPEIRKSNNSVQLR